MKNLAKLYFLKFDQRILIFVYFLFIINLPGAVETSQANSFIQPFGIRPLTDTSKISQDTISHKERRKQKKELSKTELRNSNSRFVINAGLIFAKLNTKVIFNPPGSVVSVTIGLEENFELSRQSTFFSGAMLFRITPTSGLYFNYYGFNRSRQYITDRDYSWGGDTIPEGTKAEVYIKTQVISAGYLLSILKDLDAFLGLYFNVYIMPLSLGVRSDLNLRDSNLSAIIPLPNVGLVAMFSLTKWLSVHGNVGFFSLYTDAFGGYINDLNISVLFKATKWLNFNLNYQKFYVHVLFPDQKINTSVNYDFQGPSVGITLKF
jgi:hypothetical protein